MDTCYPCIESAFLVIGHLSHPIAVLVIVIIN
jgi:hypothetical protein